MGTIVEVTLKEDNPSAAEAAFSEIERLEKILSSYRPDSEVSKVSKNAGKGGVRVSPEVIEVMEAALKIAELSGGAFDPTIGAVFGDRGGDKGGWDFSGEKNYVPSKKEIGRLLPLVDYREMFIDKKASVAGLKKKGMRVDLGGVAKGYIAGRAMEVLKKHGIDWAILRAGGDMTVFNKVVSGPFTIGVQHPREKEKLLGKLKAANGAVATSGDYERFFIKDGVRYHHIIDPRTGYPADKCRSVTILSEDPAIADALSTAVFVLGPEKGMKLIETLGGVEGIIVDRDGLVSISSGLNGRFEGI